MSDEMTIDDIELPSVETDRADLDLPDPPDADPGPTVGTALSAESVLGELRTKGDTRYFLRGIAPLVLAAVLFVLMVLLAPSVAPEHNVERPIDDPAAEDTP